MIDRPDWSTTTQTGTALVPAAPVEQMDAPVTEGGRMVRPDLGPAPSQPARTSGSERHTNTAEHSQWRDGQRSSDETVVDLDEADAAKYRKLIADGVFTAEELAEHYGLDEAELDALTNRLRPGTRAAIDAEIAAIERRIREDRLKYFKDEKAQASYRDLLEQRANLPAKVAKAESEAQRVDQGDAPGLDPDLLASWEKQGGIETNLRQVQATAHAVVGALEPDEAEALENGFDALPDGAKTQVYAFLAVQGGGAWPGAGDAALKEFASTDEGAELVQEWGRQAARNVGVVKGRMGLMLNSMTPEDRSKAETWFNNLSSNQAKAVLKALAGG